MNQFPILDARLVKKYFEHLISKDPLLGQIQSHADIHLGGHRYEMDEEELITEKEKIGNTLEIKFSEIEDYDLEKLAIQLFESGQNHIQQVHEMMIKDLQKVTDLTGNVTSLEGKEITADHVIDTIEQIKIAFDEKGNPQYPQIIAGSELADKLSKLEVSEEQEKRLENIINKKRQKYFAEKRNRRLSFID
ncbi:hypothetical protein [Fodinibius salsisoli]|uniref:Uncharacterized protein n=1 Tax=Fodinibius salsisoli TaxID=2820877 RepID=A0ABT3PQA9_9BACT|nr:hypothetical protein [Fodinibius salsisoli]MCW9708048.1 hypothetical protein [Fodinibius salsisoli]